MSHLELPSREELSQKSFTYGYLQMFGDLSSSVVFANCTALLMYVVIANWSEWPPFHRAFVVFFAGIGALCTVLQIYVAGIHYARKVSESENLEVQGILNELRKQYDKYVAESSEKFSHALKNYTDLVTYIHHRSPKLLVEYRKSQEDQSEPPEWLAEMKKE